MSLDINSLSRRMHLAFDGFSVLQLERENATLARVVIAVALLRRQAVEICLDESQLLEPVDCAGGEDKDSAHPEPCRFIDQVRYDLSAHAQMPVDGVCGDRGYLRLS